MRYVIPWIGGLVSVNGKPMRYLPASSESFLSAEELAERMASARVLCRRFPPPDGRNDRKSTGGKKRIFLNTKDTTETKGKVFFGFLGAAGFATIVQQARCVW